MEYLASTTSVQNLDPETIVKFMNSSGIEKSLMLQHKKLKTSFLESSCPLIYIF